MIDLFLKGGILMFPLLLGSVLMLAIIIERSIILLGAGISQKKIIVIKKKLLNKEYEEALRPEKDFSDPVSLLIKEAVLLRSKKKDFIDNELSIKGDRLLGDLNKRLHFLSLIGQVAPMIGLLGTVLGMVDAFHDVASVIETQGTVDPSILADGIWKALITTVAGLFVGIPALISFHLFKTRVKSIAFNMKHYLEEALSMLKVKND